MNPDMTPEELLNFAKGATPAAKDATSKQTLIEYFLQPFGNTSAEQKKFVTRRREFRKTIHNVRWKLHHNQTNFTAEEIAVKEIIDSRINPNAGITWENFTFQWDVSPNPESPGKVIRKHEWFKEGGAVDNDMGSFYPAAFTEQEL